MWLAVLTIPMLRHDWHNGCLPSCWIRMVRHVAVWYIPLRSSRCSLGVVCQTSRPPCSIQLSVYFDLQFLHPSCWHLVLLGRYGINNQGLGICELGCYQSIHQYQFPLRPQLPFWNGHRQIYIYLRQLLDQ